MMGMAVRSGEFFPLYLAPLFWARLVRSPVTAGILAQSHHSNVTAMAQFAGIHYKEDDRNIVLDGAGKVLCEAAEFEEEYDIVRSF